MGSASTCDVESPLHAPGPLVATLLGLALSNSGVIPCDAPAVYGVVNKYLLPLAVPLLLYSADMRCAALCSNTWDYGVYSTWLNTSVVTF